MRGRGDTLKPGPLAPVAVALDLSPALDASAVERQLVAFVRTYAAGARADGVVIGLSGGVDSAVCAAIAARALGPERVLALMLPHATSHPEDAAHARLVADALRVPHETVDVTPIVDAAARACGAHALRDGPAFNNLKSRSRMMVLYAHANATNRLVVGTGNKSELLTGYFTKYGDGGADVYPIGDLYKTQVFALARHLGLPSAVVEKPPTAGLFPGQTDEAELGITYALLDRVLGGFEAGHPPEVVARALGVGVEDVRRVEARVLASEHKRTSLVIPKVGFRTPGLDWRAPRQRAPSPEGGIP